MSARASAGAALIVIAAVLVVLTRTPTTAQAPAAPGQALSRVVEGNYRVTFICVFADQTTKSEKVEQVRRIEFHPEYIVVIDHTDAGRVVPVHALAQFQWEPS
ncbi:MAG TPA: hypothetical protein PL151_19115 [Phycisphaerae bacterium]|nr:hypothetical protein [Phycisphaerae bacterium]HOJ73534.1 hypothetical protein [Phycisphaerae bacterium]HOM51658.1 hypothetical protein [Phycisphaerae bacterium]HON68820.1 hypothetical protein [Phycisphaerae bacterium]HOQ86422.1 hypothetical protein [Phycisphaerae bacterium]